MENEESPQPNGGGDGGDGNKKEESRPAGLREIALRIGAIANVVLQCVNIALLAINAWPAEIAKQVGRGMVFGSSGVGIVHSPVVMYKERQLTKENTFRTALNGIREQQGRLTEQNDVLSAEIDDLQSEVDRMKDVEQALRELSETQGSQLDELMELIKENKRINQGLRSTLKSKVLEEVIGLVLDIDKDGNFTIEDREVDRLIMGMKLLEGIVFDEDMFRTEVKNCGGNVDQVIMLIKAMIHGSDHHEDAPDTDCQIDLDINEEEFFNKQKGQMGR